MKCLKSIYARISPIFYIKVIERHDLKLKNICADLYYIMI